MIKFRVWDKLTQKYWNIENWHFEDEYLDLIEPGVSICDPRIERIWRKQGDVEIMQYTGLTDVNGKDIYEGDIIVSKPNELTFESPKIGVVKRSKISAGWSYITATDEYNIWTSGKYRTYEVIGNVHANPELLEEEK